MQNLSYLSIKKKLILKWNENPLPLILLAGIFFRLLAVIFSKGFGMSDDHFLIIESAQSWVDGHDYNNWLPTITKSVINPTGHSLFYPGLHYLLFFVLQKAGMSDPQTKMYIVRALHALYSLLIIYFGYKIALKKQGMKSAREAGIILAILFFMPNFSVRNLVEMVCIPPLMMASWYVLKNDFQDRKSAIIAGIMLGVALSMRFQSITFTAGFFLALLILKQWKNLWYSIFGFILCILLIQSLTDVLIWKKPFVEITEYVRYNLANKEGMGASSWSKYILVLAGLLIPPLSLMLMFGFVRNWRKNLILFLPSFIFFVFHSSFPNKQERFILPVIPFVITLGMIGWNELLITYHEKLWLKKLTKFAWIFFLSVNLLPLIVVSTSYSKRSRVEAMSYLHDKKDTPSFILEESTHDDYKLPPLFYFGNWGRVYFVTTVYPLDSLLMTLKNTDKKNWPKYVVFNQAENMDARYHAFKNYFPDMKYETTIEPGFLDALLCRMNPKNANYTSSIYKIGYGKDVLQRIENVKYPLKDK